jgi:hypothetical protein
MAIKIFGTTIIGGEAQRKEAASNTMSGKYPLTNDCNLMKSTIEAAKAELAQINASRPSTAGGKRIKARNADALKVWINEMQNFLKDLTCGIVYTPEGIKITPVAAPAVMPSPTTPTAPTPVAQQPIIFTPDVVKNYEQPSIKCADGTYDVANGVNPPCANKGGVYLPSLPLPAPAPVLPSGQSTIISAPAPVNQPLPTASLPSQTGPNAADAAAEYAKLYDTAALGTAIAQSNGSAPAPVSAPAAQDDTQKYLMYGGIALIGVLVLNSLTNRD